VSRECKDVSTISASIGVYRPQSGLFGGRYDGKIGGLQEEAAYFQMLMSAGDN